MQCDVYANAVGACHRVVDLIVRMGWNVSTVSVVSVGHAFRLHNTTSCLAMPINLLQNSVVVDYETVYRGFFDVFSVVVPTKSCIVRHAWKALKDDGHFEYMRQFSLSEESNGRVHDCTSSFSLGSSGVLFKYGVGPDGCAIYCLKLIPHVWVPPVGLSKCDAIVAHTVFAAGRVQLMVHATSDLWTLAQAMKRVQRHGSRAERMLEVVRFRRISHFLASSVVQLLRNDVVMTDMKLENVLVNDVGANETYGLCDLESFSELDGSSLHPTRCTFEPCSRSASVAVLTTAFAAACTAIDLGNSLVDEADEVDFDWCYPNAKHADEFTLRHPVVISATKRMNDHIEPWVGALRALARHKIWGNQALDKAFALSVFDRLEACTQHCLNETQ